MIFSIFKRYLNFSKINFVSTILSSILFTALSFADLDGGFFFISFDDGIKGFLLTALKETPLRFFNGKYLETLFVDEILLKKDLHILSSIE